MVHQLKLPLCRLKPCSETPAALLGVREHTSLSRSRSYASHKHGRHQGFDMRAVQARLVQVMEVHPFESDYHDSHDYEVSTFTRTLSPNHNARGENPH